MNIGKSLKLLIGALTLWPLLYIVAFIVGMPHIAASNFDTLFTVHMATVVLSMGLLVFYVVHLFKTKRIEPGYKALWGLCLFMGGQLAWVIYFFMHVWPEQSSEWALDSIVPPTDSLKL